VIAQHAASAAPAAWLPAVPLVLAVGAYGFGVARLRRRGDAWSPARTTAAGAGVAVLALALLPPLAGHTQDFPRHVTQHLLVSALAPLLLALSAPVTLALRALPVRGRSRLLRLLHSSAAQLLVHPAVVLALSVGGLYAFYLTPLFWAAASSPLVHVGMHLHMLLAGYLLSSYLLGIDPMPRQAGVATRLLVLVAAAAAHDVLAKLLYAHTLPVGAGPAAEIRGGAQLMYYGGTAVELALAVALLAAWYARGGRELQRQRRRAQLRASP